MPLKALSDSGSGAEPTPCGADPECKAQFRIIRILLKEVNENVAKVSERQEMLVEKVLVGNGRPSLVTRMDLVESKVETVNKRTELPTAAAIVGLFVGAVFSGVTALLVFKFTH